MKKLYFVYLLLLCQLGLAQTQQAPVYRPDDSLKATSTAKRVSMLLSPATTVSAVARPVDPIEFFPPEDPYPPGNPLPPDNPLPPPGSPAPPVNTSDSFHDTRGNIEVNGGGQLQFTLPVALPPGVKTVAPQINLVYTSGSGNGIAGYGWSLSGITAISRVGRNIEKDGEVRGIQLDYTDYYSFNGQRLILKSGVYGKDGAEYVTEKFSNVKIKSLGAILGQQWQGPEYWEVTFEDGSQAWYGATGTGAGNGRTPVEYNIVKWRDAQGNYISYQYSLSNNVAVVSSITWGGNEDLGKPHFNEITYTYKNRQLKEMSFVQGVKFVQNLILDKITVNTNGSLFKEYQLTYKITDGTSRYEIPESIIEKNSAGIAARPVTFKNSAAHNQIIKQQVANNLSSPNQYVYGDFNGDGRIDALHYSSGYPATELCLREDNNGYCEEYETVPGLSPGTYITYNKLNNSTDAVKVSDENLSKGIASNFLDNGEVVGRSTITVKNVGADGINFKTYVVKNEVMVLISQSVVPKSVYDHTTQYVPPPRSYEPYSTTTTTLGTFKEIDVNGDGISELLFSITFPQPS
tara:strand:+ start:5269 stop:6993 length:1725 start_codon:yes stop_codon:yes gene_type:complete